MPSGIASGLDLARFEKQRAKYARRRMRALRLRSPWLPEDIQERATLRRISYGVKRAGEGQTRLTQTAPDASSGAPRRSADHRYDAALARDCRLDGEKVVGLGSMSTDGQTERQRDERPCTPGM